MTSNRTSRVKSQPMSGGWLRAIYSLILILALPLIYGYLWWHGRKNPAYRQRWSERGTWQKVPQNARGSWVFHCVSVGELMAAKPLIDLALSLNPRQPITVTCTTPTGSELVQKWYGDRIYHCYLPFDTPFAVRRFLSRLQPRAVVVLETELWPNLVAQCYQHYIPVVLANARMSDRSARGYHKARALMRPTWRALSLVLAQNEASQAHFIALGCAPEKVAVAGNIKFDVQVNAAVKQQAHQLKNDLAGRQVITLGSSHEGEEAIALDAFENLLKVRPDTLLVIVPRHQERFDEVAAMINARGLQMQRRSAAEVIDIKPATQVFLADSMGEMLLWFGASTVATIGGSLIERGGHNPLEAMAFGLPIVSGRHVFNFAEVYQQLDARQAVRWVQDSQSLHDTWLGLLVETATAERIGAQAQQLFARHRGATQRSLEALTEVLA